MSDTSRAQVQRYERGSEWRKWDLHTHAPGSKLEDAYAKQNGVPDWNQFCQLVHDSEVAAIAITDYFSLDSYFAFVEEYEALFPDDDKLVIPNLELRLPEALNKDGQSVNLHVLFRPTLTRADADKFLMALETDTTVGKAAKRVQCAELSSPAEFMSATVSRDSIQEAIDRTFGPSAVRQEHLLIVASAKGDGIRPGGKSSKQRKRNLSDEIDKFSDAFYAGPVSRDYFLEIERLDSDEDTPRKPVFDGCDAHSFETLRDRLGKPSTEAGTEQYVTWIKADPTYEGLLQTLIEPSDRVALQTTEPDQKEPYKVISRVRFSGTAEFPSEVILNRNLNAIIGSRSSGKSALLAFIAHAVNPAGTVEAQVAASDLNESAVGPAAGKTWDDVSGSVCEVDWESADAVGGRVIYIPQNSLYKISESPETVTQRIAPALMRTFSDVKTAHERARTKIDATNDAIGTAVNEWFALATRIASLAQKVRDLGDRDAIEAERDRLQEEIDRIRAAAKLTDDEIEKYEAVAGLLQTKQDRIAAVAGDLDQLAPYVAFDADGGQATVVPTAAQISITIQPSTAELPETMATRLDILRDEAANALHASVQDALAAAATDLAAERTRLSAESATVLADNADLIEKHQANDELAEVIGEHKKQVSALTVIDKDQQARVRLEQAQANEAAKIVKALAERATAFATLTAAFRNTPRILDDLTFGIETEVSAEAVDHASHPFNQRSTNHYIRNKGDPVDYQEAQADPATFLAELRDEQVALNRGYGAPEAAKGVLTTTPEIRFTAELDGDRIGGFSRSSMTPGKQALFALTLILNETQEPWPLLIDQPEDDLDSRSIYYTIVPYLTSRKRERQIIMVSHDANLVIGADSEEVIVTNRHGADRPNKGGRMFEYLTGSLEHTQELNDKSPTVLGRFGIREHACEILDGGEEAFQKRRQRYKI